MNNLLKTVTSKAKIRFQHCDPFNHLNNANYINYFINHREDMILEHYNIDMFKMARETGQSWVSTSNQIAYLKPAFLMETVTIESQLFRESDSDLMVEMRMFNEDKTHLKSIIWCGFTHFDIMNQKRAYHSNEMNTLFKSILNPIEAKTFESRLLEIRSKKATV
ncbi:acyl-CoA thioesterase [uncultured Lacinutrix sp.]|uniref:acyl-CoA thioesterase n=1 Tax=uncultured Lacinutrix sp. TaxID=574032 RepID=UPI002631EC47|nr:acyl-CoA thioesterase [uncultured Lacinutrix sp.]